MAKEAIHTMIGGIKCDNPECNFRDMSVHFDDYKNWLNKPCPLCGENLLTRKDYNACKMIVGITKAINKFVKVPDDYNGNDDLIVHYDFHDGRGISKISTANTYVEDGKHPEANALFNKKNAEWLELELLKAKKEGKIKPLNEIDHYTLKLLVNVYSFTDTHLSYIFGVSQEEVKNVKRQKKFLCGSLECLTNDMQEKSIYNIDEVYQNCII